VLFTYMFAPIMIIIPFYIVMRTLASPTPTWRWCWPIARSACRSRLDAAHIPVDPDRSGGGGDDRRRERFRAVIMW
jgi:hypothetical protein